MSTRSQIIEVTARLLADSPTGEVSTRAVCEAAGVQQPVIYRHFGDKDGLLAATVDHVWEQYLGMKRAAEASEDPLDDLVAGWRSHVRFALEHPHAYRLVFASSLKTAPEAAEEAMRLLRQVLERLAAQGRLRLPPADAAQLVLAANSGVCLSLLLRPSAYPDPAIAELMREMVFQTIVTDAPVPASGSDATAMAATTLRSALAETAQANAAPAPKPEFSPAEAALLDEWLERIQNS